jgi:hypothetical protein
MSGLALGAGFKIADVVVTGVKTYFRNVGIEMVKDELTERHDYETLYKYLLEKLTIDQIALNKPYLSKLKKLADKASKKRTGGKK